MEIFADVLYALAQDKLKKTHVSHKANLDSRATDRYLRSLMKMQIVSRSDEDKAYFVIKQRGREFLRIYEELLSFCGPEYTLNPFIES